MTDVVIVPRSPALLPEYASMQDPVHDMRAAAVAAVRWLAIRSDRIEILAGDSGGCRVARALLTAAGHPDFESASFDGTPEPAAGLLVVADGSARRGEKAPGYVDVRCFDFDKRLDAALRSGETAALRTLDLGLAAELLAEGAPVLARLATALAGRAVSGVDVDYADDPYGVMYWVVRWQCVH